MDFIEILKVLVLGIVEGFTEWLPISSTGHMILVDEIIQLHVTEEFMKMFRVVIQLGAILAVVVLYFHRLNPFDRGKTQGQKIATVLSGLRLQWPVFRQQCLDFCWMTGWMPICTMLMW